jgi:hypothetical protein
MRAATVVAMNKTKDSGVRDVVVVDVGDLVTDMLAAPSLSSSSLVL